MMPEEYVPIALSLIGTAAKLIGAQNDDERIEALMEHAEKVKAELDRLKFGR